MGNRRSTRNVKIILKVLQTNHKLLAERLSMKKTCKDWGMVAIML